MKQTVKDFLPKKGKTEEDELWPFLKERYDLGLELRRPFEEKWIIALTFLSGRQYSFYNRNAQLLQQTKQIKGRLRVVDNKILPRYTKQVSRLIRSQPRMSVVPASTDQNDLKAAKVGDKVLKHFWRQNKMRQKIRQLGGWIYSCGNGFLDDRWNPKMGPMATAEDGSLVYLGDVDCGVWSPFEVGLPAFGMNDMSLDEMAWCWKAKYRTLDWIKTQYPKRGKEVSSEGVRVPFVDVGMIFGLERTTSKDKIEGASVIELKVKPCSEYPKGLFLVGANGVILDKQDYPFESYHLEQFKDIEVPGVFWGMATTDAAIWLQKLWNRGLSDVAEFNRTMARGKWLIPRNAEVEVIPDDAHGQRILYNPVLGHKPEILTLKGLPQTYQQVFLLVAQSLMELYSQHEVTQGTNKSDIRSGEMVSLLLEQDDYGNIPTHAIFEESLEAVMTRVLKRIQRGYSTERVLSITGIDGELEVFNFTGADLGNNTDVNVIKDSTIPDSKTARQLRIKDNYKEGLYGDPMEEGTRERVLRMLDEVPDDFKDVFKESHLDRQNARVENEVLAQGKGQTLVMANIYDNPVIHLEEHRLYRKQPEHQKLKRENPKAFVELEIAFDNHEALHRQMQKEQEEAQMAQIIRMEQMKGGMKGGGKGTGATR